MGSPACNAGAKMEKAGSNVMQPDAAEEQLSFSMRQLHLLSDAGPVDDVTGASQSQEHQHADFSPASAARQQECKEQGQPALLPAEQYTALPIQHTGMQQPETDEDAGIQHQAAAQLLGEQQQLEQRGEGDSTSNALQQGPQQKPELGLQHKEGEQKRQEQANDRQQEELEPAAEEDNEKEEEEEHSVASQPPERLLSSWDVNGVASLIRDGRVKRIVCMCGAGISVSAGIPDFRTPGTGLYSQLASYNLPRPEAVFSLDYFRANPEPFHRLAKELFPGHYKPTVTHYFMSLLHKKGLLLRCFTQNIDSLETLAGLPKQMVVPAHGNFDSASCISCGTAHSTDWVRKTIFAGQICKCRSCSSLVKPDIVFFGEALPEDFDVRRKLDLPQCDLLITMGTSLAVWPFAGLLYDVSPHVPRLLINREVVGLASDYDMLMGGMRSAGYLFHSDDNYRDALYQGDCDDGVRILSDLLGWRQELEELMQQGHAAMDVDVAADKAATSQEAHTVCDRQ